MNHLIIYELEYQHFTKLPLVYVLVPKISKRVQNLVNAALGKMGKTSLREQKGRL